jgi:hypothetical protein
MKKGPFELTSHFFFWAFSWEVWTESGCRVMTHEKFTEVKTTKKYKRFMNLQIFMAFSEYPNLQSHNRQFRYGKVLTLLEGL